MVDYVVLCDATSFWYNILWQDKNKLKQIRIKAIPTKAQTKQTSKAIQLLKITTWGFIIVVETYNQQRSKVKQEMQINVMPTKTPTNKSSKATDLLKMTTWEIND